MAETHPGAVPGRAHDPDPAGDRWPGRATSLSERDLPLLEQAGSRFPSGGSPEGTPSGRLDAAAGERPPAGGGTAGDAGGSKAPGPRRRWLGLHRLTLAVLLVGLLGTGATTTASRLNYLHNEHRLISLQAKLTATVLALAPYDVERLLGSAVDVVAATGGSLATFDHDMAGSLTPRGPFAAIRLYEIGPAADRQLASIGGPTTLPMSTARARAFLQTAAARPVLAVERLATPHSQRFAYAMAAAGHRERYVLYAEQVLPADRRVTISPSNPIANLDFALYFGRAADDAALIESNARTVPLAGTTATARVPFGDTELTIVMASNGSLAGTFAAYIAWGILAFGLLFTLAIAAMTERLVRRRDTAEALAEANRRLFQSQRSVAETLQHSLLPERLPRRPALETAVRYLPGTAGIDVGGDWYDMVEIDERTVFFSIGDVAGRGLAAATLMSLLRNSMNAYAMDGATPAEVLEKLNRLVGIARDATFATVLCGRLDEGSGRLAIASAGHFSPLVADSSGARYLETPVGPPVGTHDSGYVTGMFELSPGATLLLFTDGLVERRGESLVAGLSRLADETAQLTSGAGVPLEALVDRVMSSLVPAGGWDDLALLALRWHG